MLTDAEEIVLMEVISHHRKAKTLTRERALKLTKKTFNLAEIT
jgi:hypothetical protein